MSVSIKIAKYNKRSTVAGGNIKKNNGTLYYALQEVGCFKVCRQLYGQPLHGLGLSYFLFQSYMEIKRTLNVNMESRNRYAKVLLCSLLNFLFC